jgi:hypothetical protein
MIMRKAIILATLLISCSAPMPQNQNVAPVAQVNNSQSANSVDSWKRGFFKSIDERTRIANLPKLTTITLPSEDLEVRVWHGFGITLLEGFVLRRSAGQWSAIHLDGYDERRPRSKYQINLSASKSGWEECWKRLVDAGLLTLPDASQLGEEPVDPDVMSYVVECSVGGNYRAYHYTYPEANDRREAKQMMKIGEIIFEEFGLPEFRPQQ